MKLTELQELKKVLERIKNKDPKVSEMISYVDRDIALRMQQKKEWRESMYPDYEVGPY